MNAEQIWQPVILEENREPVSHREPGEEFLFYRAVAAGLIDAVQENCDRGAFENLEGTGRLSNDPVTNLRYHFVVATAMIPPPSRWPRPSTTSTSTSWTGLP